MQRLGRAVGGLDACTRGPFGLRSTQGAWRWGWGVLNRQLLLYEVRQSLSGDVEGVKSQVIVLLLGGVETEGRLPVRGGRHWYGVCGERGAQP